MATREEIREGIEKFVSKAYWYEGKKNIVEDTTDRLIKYLHENNVVIKVDYKVKFSSPIPAGTELARIEPLIKGGSNETKSLPSSRM